MKLRTEFPPYTSTFSINHQDNILLVGSCFTENIGKKMQTAKFNACVNPLGIAFNPISLHKHLNFSMNKMSNLVISKRNDIYFHSDFHSKFNALSEESYRETIKSKAIRQSDELSKANNIFITYGTAWVYEQIADQQIVNNCHKLPANNFNKKLLSVNEIVSSFKTCLENLSTTYSKNFTFVFTLSPVRHLKDGWNENQLSKSTLLLAINSICEQFPNCYYFPAYEIMMDDLRDYRFYKADLVHPNKQAINYLWEIFQRSYFSKNTLQLIEQIEKIHRSIKHRAFNEKSVTHQHFLSQLLKRIELVATTHELDFKNEIQLIKQKLS